MESHAQSVEDNLIDSLSFKLRPGASYITDRRSVTYFPVNGGSYGPNGVKVVKVMLNGSDSWLDPSTLNFSSMLLTTHLYHLTINYNRWFQVGGDFSAECV